MNEGREGQRKDGMGWDGVGWVDRWMDGWDRWTGVRTEKHLEGGTEEMVDRRMDGVMDAWVGVI